MPSRRTFLACTGGALSAALLAPVLPQARPDRQAFELFFDQEALPALRERFTRHTLFARLRDELSEIDRAAERRFIAEELVYNDHLYHIQRLSTLSPQLAFLYAMTGDQDAADLAIEATDALMRFPKWDYFLDGPDEVIGIQRASGAVFGVACTADWLGEALDASTRREWIGTMAELGCEPCFRSLRGMRYPDTVRGWRIDPSSTYLEHRPGDRNLDLSNWPHILDRTNLKAVPASALAVGALAYRLEFGSTEGTDRWLEQAVFSLDTFRDLFARDGSYDEGVSYANYTTLHLVHALEALRRHDGRDLFDIINWMGFTDYICAMTLPTAGDPHAIVNFGDAGQGMRSDVPFWVARRAGDPRAQWFGRTLATGHNVWSVIWYPPDQPSIPPPDGPSLWHSDLDWIVARTGYRADDLVVAMRSGGPANHEHADRNSIIVKCFGEPLVADPYRPPYSNADPAWILRTTAGHSALLIDGRGHQYHDGSEGTNASDAVARLIRTSQRRGRFLWTSDATPAYQLVLPDLQSVTRTVLVLYDVPALLICDKVVAGSAPVRLQARYFGYNTDGRCVVTTDDDHFTLARPNANLHGFAFSTDGCTLTPGTLPLPPETARLHPYLDAATERPGLAPLLVTVLVPMRTSEDRPHVEAAVNENDAVLELTLSRPGHLMKLAIEDSGRIPEVHLQV